MRALIFALPLLSLAACNVSKEGNAVTVQYDQNTAENTAADVGNFAQNVAGDIGNDVQRTAPWKKGVPRAGREPALKPALRLARAAGWRPRRPSALRRDGRRRRPSSRIRP